MIEIDGSQGEGGGQILRSSLSLAICTQEPFRITNIRANRDKPGLLRQHLTAVKAAAEICNGELTGAEIGSRELTFKPGKLKGGNYSFAIDTAGSSTLVLQTVLGRGGSFTTAQVTEHLRSNASVIEAFMGKRVTISDTGNGFAVRVR